MYLSGYDAWKLADGLSADRRKVVSVCVSCRDDIYEGDSVWQHEDDEGIKLCSLGCLTYFTVNYAADIDEFDKIKIEA